jgi:hypothetical protein
VHALFGRPVRSQARIAGGRCGRREMDLASGPGRERRSDERGPAAGGESGRALGLRGRRALAGRGGVGRAWEQGGVGWRAGPAW